MSEESWQQNPVTMSDWDRYFVWIHRIILKINPDERTEFRIVLGNIRKEYREYLRLDHEASLKRNPITTKKLATDKLAELHQLVAFMAENLVIARLGADFS